MPYTRMKRIFLQGLLWLYLLGFGYMALSLDSPSFLDFDNLPDTNFSCVGKVIGGYYADLETNCQMFHVCTIGQLDEPMDIRFLCLNGTVFDQETRVCERIDEVDCSKSEQFYSLNLELYGNTQPAILEESPETDAPLIIKSTAKPTTTTTTSTTTPRPTLKTTRTPYFTTAAPPTITTTNRNQQQIISTHHFPVVNSNSPDIRFNPEEINISLNPGAPPDIRTRPLTFHQSFSENSNINNNKVIVTTHSPFNNVKEQVIPNREIDSSRIQLTTQKPKSVVSYGLTHSNHNNNNNRQTVTPSDINFGFTFHQQEDQTEYQSEPEHNYHYQSNFRPNFVQHRNQFKSSTFRNEFTPTTARNRYQQNKPTTMRNHYLQSLKPPQLHQPHPHHFHQVLTEKPQRLQLPLPLLPTLSPLTFSSPAPFSLPRHIETKRYTKEHQAPPRIIISASASVSDASGRRLNYSLGQIGAAHILEQPPHSYDEYKEGDVGLDPFYHDVPKIKRRSKRSTKGIKHSDIIRNEQEAVDVLKFLFDWYKSHEQTSTITIPVSPSEITEINDELSPTPATPLVVEEKEVDVTTKVNRGRRRNSSRGRSNFQNSQLFKGRNKFNIVSGAIDDTENPQELNKNKLKRGNPESPQIEGKSKKIDIVVDEIYHDNKTIREDANGNNTNYHLESIIKEEILTTTTVKTDYNNNKSEIIQNQNPVVDTEKNETLPSLRSIINTNHEDKALINNRRGSRRRNNNIKESNKFSTEKENARIIDGTNKSNRNSRRKLPPEEEQQSTIQEEDQTIPIESSLLSSNVSEELPNKQHEYSVDIQKPENPTKTAVDINQKEFEEQNQKGTVTESNLDLVNTKPADHKRKVISNSKRRLPSTTEEIYQEETAEHVKSENADTNKNPKETDINSSEKLLEDVQVSITELNPDITIKGDIESTTTSEKPNSSKKPLPKVEENPKESVIDKDIDHGDEILITESKHEIVSKDKRQNSTNEPKRKVISVKQRNSRRRIQPRTKDAPKIDSSQDKHGDAVVEQIKVNHENSTNIKRVETNINNAEKYDKKEDNVTELNTDIITKANNERELTTEKTRNSRRRPLPRVEETDQDSEVNSNQDKYDDESIVEQIKVNHENSTNIKRVEANINNAEKYDEKEDNVTELNTDIITKANNERELTTEKTRNSRRRPLPSVEETDQDKYDEKSVVKQIKISDVNNTNIKYTETNINNDEKNEEKVNVTELNLDIITKAVNGKGFTPEKTKNSRRRPLPKIDGTPPNSRKDSSQDKHEEEPFVKQIRINTENSVKSIETNMSNPEKDEEHEEKLNVTEINLDIITEREITSENPRNSRRRSQPKINETYPDSGKDSKQDKHDYAVIKPIKINPENSTNIKNMKTDINNHEKGKEDVTELSLDKVENEKGFISEPPKNLEGKLQPQIEKTLEDKPNDPIESTVDISVKKIEVDQRKSISEKPRGTRRRSQSRNRGGYSVVSNLDKSIEEIVEHAKATKVNSDSPRNSRRRISLSKIEKEVPKNDEDNNQKTNIHEKNLKTEDKSIKNVSADYETSSSKTKEIVEHISEVGSVLDKINDENQATSEKPVETVIVQNLKEPSKDKEVDNNRTVEDKNTENISEISVDYDQLTPKIEILATENLKDTNITTKNEEIKSTTAKPRNSRRRTPTHNVENNSDNHRNRRRRIRKKHKEDAKESTIKELFTSSESSTPFTITEHKNEERHDLSIEETSNGEIKEFKTPINRRRTDLNMDNVSKIKEDGIEDVNISHRTKAVEANEELTDLEEDFILEETSSDKVKKNGEKFKDEIFLHEDDYVNDNYEPLPYLEPPKQDEPRDHSRNSNENQNPLDYDLSQNPEHLEDYVNDNYESDLYIKPSTLDHDNQETIELNSQEKLFNSTNNFSGSISNNNSDIVNDTDKVVLDGSSDVKETVEDINRKDSDKEETTTEVIDADVYMVNSTDISQRKEENVNQIYPNVNENEPYKTEKMEHVVFQLNGATEAFNLMHDFHTASHHDTSSTTDINIEAHDVTEPLTQPTGTTISSTASTEYVEKRRNKHRGRGRFHQSLELDPSTVVTDIPTVDTTPTTPFTSFETHEMHVTPFVPTTDTISDDNISPDIHITPSISTTETLTNKSTDDDLSTDINTISTINTEPTTYENLDTTIPNEYPESTPEKITDKIVSTSTEKYATTVISLADYVKDIEENTGSVIAVMSTVKSDEVQTESIATSPDIITTETTSKITIESTTNEISSTTTPFITTTPIATTSTTTRRRNDRRRNNSRDRPRSNSRGSSSRHRFSTNHFTQQPIFAKTTLEQDIVESLKMKTNAYEVTIESTSPSNVPTTAEDEVLPTDAPLYRSANPTLPEHRKDIGTTTLSIVQKRIRLDKKFIFNCFDKEINKFFPDPRDCRLFHYCTPGFNKNQLLDMKFVCDLNTFFDDKKLICTKNKPKRCL